MSVSVSVGVSVSESEKRSPSSSSADCFNCCQSSADHTVSSPQSLALQRSLVTLSQHGHGETDYSKQFAAHAFGLFLSFVKLALSMLC